jgi:hypothetical protein
MQITKTIPIAITAFREIFFFSGWVFRLLPLV